MCWPGKPTVSRVTPRKVNITQLGRSHLALGARHMLSYAPIAFNQRWSQEQLAIFLTLVPVKEKDHPSVHSVADDGSADARVIPKKPIHVVVSFELHCLIDISGATAEKMQRLMTGKPEPRRRQEENVHRPQREKKTWSNCVWRVAAWWCHLLGSLEEVSQAWNIFSFPITGLLTLTFLAVLLESHVFSQSGGEKMHATFSCLCSDGQNLERKICLWPNPSCWWILMERAVAYLWVNLEPITPVNTARLGTLMFCCPIKFAHLLQVSYFVSFAKDGSRWLYGSFQGCSRSRPALPYWVC